MASYRRFSPHHAVLGALVLTAAMPFAPPSSQTFDDETAFLDQLSHSTTFDFEMASGFPAVGAQIGTVEGAEFHARSFGGAPTSGSQTMTGGAGTNSPATIQFSGCDPVGFGFFGLDLTVNEIIRVTVDFTDGPDQDFDVRLGAGDAALTPTYFGFVSHHDSIESLTIRGTDDSGSVRTWYLDDLTIAFDVSTFDQQGNFLHELGHWTTFDFETASGFPAAAGVIGSFEGVSFNARTYLGSAPTSGTQAMAGSGVPVNFTQADITFPGVKGRGFGFFALDLTVGEVVRVTVDFTNGPDRVFDVGLAPGDPAFTPTYFGLQVHDDTIDGFSLLGTDGTGAARSWYIDDLAVGFEVTTFDDETTFVAQLRDPKSFDFETGSGFPPAAGAIGMFEGLDFTARTYPGGTSTSGTQSMAGSGVPANFTQATIGFPELKGRAFGFFALDLTVGEVIRVTVDFTDGPTKQFDAMLAPGDPAFTPTYFGLIAENDTIESLTFEGTDNMGANRSWYIDDLTVGFAVTLFDSEKAFFGQLIDPTTFDFEVASGFPSSGNRITQFGGLDFNNAKTFMGMPISGRQTMTGSGPGSGTESQAFIDLQGCNAKAFGFHALDLTANEVILVTVNFTRGPSRIFAAELQPGDPDLTPAYFGLIAENDTIETLTFRGANHMGATRPWYIDDLTIALDTVPVGTIGTLSTFGAGCPGSAGTPILEPAPNQLPWVGEPFTIEMAPIPMSAFSTPFGILGFSKTMWMGISLPQDLTLIGLFGCTQYVALDLAVPMVKNAGTASWTIDIPQDPSLIGLDFYQQGLVLDIGVNPANAVVSNALEGMIGAR